MGDDQAGLMVAERLAQRAKCDALIEATELPATTLPDPDQCGAGLLVVVDASPADDRHPPGSSVRIDYGQDGERLRPKGRLGTHTLSVDAGLELAAALDILPEQVWLYVIFGLRFERDQATSAPVAAGLEALVEQIECDVIAWTEAELQRP